jgi:hypothetical protein
MGLPRELHATGDERVADMPGRGETERTSRSSMGTTRVSLVWTAARVWSSPGRARLVPVNPLSR